MFLGLLIGRSSAVSLQDVRSRITWVIFPWRKEILKFPGATKWGLRVKLFHKKQKREREKNGLLETLFELLDPASPLEFSVVWLINPSYYLSQIVLFSSLEADRPLTNAISVSYFLALLPAPSFSFLCLAWTMAVVYPTSVCTPVIFSYWLNIF